LVQAGAVYDFLEQIATQKQSGTPDSEIPKVDLRTAVILADEQQLFPVLSSIPPQFSPINITLGYPLKSTPAFALAEILLARSEEHTSELQSRENLVCRLL